MLRPFLILTALIIPLAMPLAALAEGCHPPVAIRFAPGMAGAETRGVVIGSSPYEVTYRLTVTIK